MSPLLASLRILLHILSELSIYSALFISILLHSIFKLTGFMFLFASRPKKGFAIITLSAFFNAVANSLKK